MTREEAIKFFKNEIEQLQRIKTEYAGQKTLVVLEDADMMAIKALEQEPKWVPVSERLPETEYNEGVIITYKDFKGEPTTDVAYMGYEGFKTIDGDDYFTDVIAWMPLPEPYQKGGE